VVFHANCAVLHFDGFWCGVLQCVAAECCNVLEQSVAAVCHATVHPSGIARKIPIHSYKNVLELQNFHSWKSVFFTLGRLYWARLWVGRFLCRCVRGIPLNCNTLQHIATHAATHTATHTAAHADIHSATHSATHSVTH